jgi:small subunit ribosomal protein S8
MPATKVKVAVARVLKDEGFILEYHVGREAAREDGTTAFEQEADLSKPKTLLRVYLKYGPEGERVIRHLARASRPGRRLFRKSKELRPVLDGLGVSIISTPKGVMSDRRARAQRLGGELLCTVW